MPDPHPIRLRPVRIEDEEAVRAAHDEMLVEGFPFALGLGQDLDFAEWVDSLDRHHRGVDLAPDRVPASFLLAEADGELVGRTSVRHELNDRLRREGGHIGYGVLRKHRRRGYATEILRQSLVVARAHGVDRVLLTCDDDNIGSIAVIEANGGRLDADEPLTGEAPTRRYWID